MLGLAPLSIAVGIMARARERSPVELYAFGGLSNHLHLLLGADDVDQLAGFMGFVNSNLAREANRVIGWKEIVDDVDAQAARRVVLNGKTPPGPEAIRKQGPHKIPEHTKKSPAPAVHATSKAVRKQMKEAYRLFVEAYREAAASLRAGNRNASFPPGCSPPPQPFIPADARLPCSRAGPARASG